MNRIVLACVCLCLAVAAGCGLPQGYVRAKRDAEYYSQQKQWDSALRAVEAADAYRTGLPEKELPVLENLRRRVGHGSLQWNNAKEELKNARAMIAEERWGNAKTELESALDRRGFLQESEVKNLTVLLESVDKMIRRGTNGKGEVKAEISP